MSFIIYWNLEVEVFFMKALFFGQFSWRHFDHLKKLLLNSPKILHKNYTSNLGDTLRFTYFFWVQEIYIFQWCLFDLQPTYCNAMDYFPNKKNNMVSLWGGPALIITEPQTEPQDGLFWCPTIDIIKPSPNFVISLYIITRP